VWDAIDRRRMNMEDEAWLEAESWRLNAVAEMVHHGGDDTYQTCSRESKIERGICSVSLSAWAVWRIEISEKVKGDVTFMTLTVCAVSSSSILVLILKS
jgi:hypothetical protein